MILENRRLFIVLSAIVFGTFCIALVLLATKPTAIKSAATIPTSPNLQSSPPETSTPSEFTATVANLPIDVTYTQTRNIQDSIGYLADPGKKGSEYTAVYRDGSVRVQGDGTRSFLVDVAAVKKTFAVYDNQFVRCASANEQLQLDWVCEAPQSDEGVLE